MIDSFTTSRGTIFDFDEELTRIKIKPLDPSYPHYNFEIEGQDLVEFVNHLVRKLSLEMRLK